MRFISKSSNLLIVLSPGLQAQPLTGTPAKPTISVRFKDGVAEVSDEKLIEMMLAHPGFNGDFISADITGVDPYAFTRRSAEPQHQLTELKFGTPVARKLAGGPPVLSPELQKIVQDMAINLAKEMLPGMVENTLKNLVEQKDSSNLNKDGKIKGKPGRPPGLKPSVKITERPSSGSANVSTQNPAVESEVA